MNEPRHAETPPGHVVVGIDGDLHDAATLAVAGTATPVEQQIGLWIRIGMAVDPGGDISQVRIEEVFEGYERLNALEQAVVRARLTEPRLKPGPS